MSKTITFYDKSDSKISTLIFETDKWVFQDGSLSNQQVMSFVEQGITVINPPAHMYSCIVN